MIDQSSLIPKLKALIPKIQWKLYEKKPGQIPPGSSMEAYEGHGNGWWFLVVYYRMSSGEEGYDGTSVGEFTLVHLPQDLARLGFETAKKKAAT